MAKYLNKHKKTVKYVHHGEDEVHTFAETQGLHREFCLCHNHCANFKPGEKGNCPIAQELFEFDVRHNLVTPVMECPKFKCRVFII